MNRKHSDQVRVNEIERREYELAADAGDTAAMERLALWYLTAADPPEVDLARRWLMRAKMSSRLLPRVWLMPAGKARYGSFSPGRPT